MHITYTRREGVCWHTAVYDKTERWWKVADTADGADDADGAAAAV